MQHRLANLTRTGRNMIDALARRRPGRGRASGASGKRGTFLLVATTAASIAVLGWMLFPLPEPPHQGPSLDIRLNPGLGGWGTGDETIDVEHLGGKRLRAADVTVLYSINETLTELMDEALGGAFSDGALVAGETWSRGETLNANQTVAVSVVGRMGGTTAVLANAPALRPCGVHDACNGI